MAEIAPFRALRYNLEKISRPGNVIAPPYDVIGDAQRTEIEARDPHNIVHVDLPRGEGDARYTAAGDLMSRWIDEGAVREDAVPAIYRYEETFRYPDGPTGKTLVRRHFIAMLKLEPRAARVVLPHENTLSGPKLDRLKLMRATRTHLSQVFVLYRDPEARIDAAFASTEARPADFDATMPDGVRHRLWVVTDETVIADVVAALRPKQVMIADGHHRYETMLTLRDELRPADRAPGKSMADWGTLCFARAEDPGLLVLPTHRLVKNVNLAGLREKLQPWFSVSDGSEVTVAAIEARLAVEGRRCVSFALRETGRAGTTWMGLRADADLTTLGPPVLRGMDVTVLHGIILDPLLGIGAEAMARQTNLGYTHVTAEALAAVDAGDAQGAFLMNAPRTHDVMAACEEGFLMPQKSTYFVPKLATGLVMARIDPLAPGCGIRT